MVKSSYFRSSGSVFNPRTITAPLAAIVMAGILYTYSVTSIRAAKRNARLHREADGGQLDMRRESLRRHGVLDKVEGTRSVDLFKSTAPVYGDEERKEAGGAGKGVAKAVKERGMSDTEPSETGGANRAVRYGEVEKRRRGDAGNLLGGSGKGDGMTRTDTEGRLEEYKGRGRLRELGTKVVPTTTTTTPTTRLLDDEKRGEAG